MIKIGMITLHCLSNCGSKLQTYALNSFLNSLENVDCEVIDFIPEALDNSRAFRIGGELKEKYKSEIELREYRFENFSKNYKLGNRCFRSDEDINQNPPHYDIYVSGSDQIWNANFRIASDAYFLGFTNAETKYAFSSSVGRCMEDKLSKYKDLLMKYKKIWVREKTGMERVKNVTGRADIGWMIDPTLLYESDQYDSFLLSNNVQMVNTEYIACYATLDDHIDQMLPMMKQLSDEYKMPVVLLGGVVPREESWIINVVDMGPVEFINIIKNASLVFTHTFHGTLFSLIYNKLFFTFNDNMPNYRKTGFLTELGLLDRIVHSQRELNEIINKKIDYEDINNKIDVLRQLAKKNIIESVTNHDDN